MPLASPIKEGLWGAPAPILIKSVGDDPEVALDPPATVTCTLAKALSTWLNESVQPQAKALFNSSVTKLHVGSYTCRNRNGGADAPLSEHALANALDISDFILGFMHVSGLWSRPLTKKRARGEERVVLANRP